MVARKPLHITFTYIADLFLAQTSRISLASTQASHWVGTIDLSLGYGDSEADRPLTLRLAASYRVRGAIALSPICLPDISSDSLSPVSISFSKTATCN
jgi:hypothetical protein